MTKCPLFTEMLDKPQFFSYISEVISNHIKSKYRKSIWSEKKIISDPVHAVLSRINFPRHLRVQRRGCLPVLCNLSCEHSVRRAIIIRGDTLHTKFSSQGKLWQFAQKENMLLSHDVCIKHRLSVWFRESVKRVIKEIKKDNSALSLPYLLHQLHCGI